ncbi:zinc-binding dehydrogenase [Alteribacillus sp. HJP-4]|uniref:zinc-binding dehydrogenase n=1 Tax=Alteribacillus sp. HJP-4 TaxID=2775394 RepID=UPI0035CCEA56
MKALIHEKQKGIAGLVYRETTESDPGPGEVRIQIKAAGLNHRDLFVLDRHDPVDPPFILGSDGAGVIDSLGEGVENHAAGEEIIINPGMGWRKNSAAPPEGFSILGFPSDGTFSESIILPEENVNPKPAHLSWEEAGVLSLSALTAYRALFTRGNVQPGDKVLIPGIGSGVATFLLQFAKAAGAEVYVTSRSEEKQKRALELGADAAIDSSVDWKKALSGEKMDLVIESIGAATFNQSFDQLRKGGTLVTFGASAGDVIQMDLRKFFYGQYNMLGSTMGSAEEYKDMLQFMEKHNVKPVIDKMFALENFKEGFQRLERADQFGKIGFVI